MGRLKSFFFFIIKGQFKFILNGISKRINSEIISIGFKRDLNDNFENPNAKIEIKTRLANKSDHAYFTDQNFNYGLVEKNIKTCYVATNSSGSPCFRVWLMESSENEKIKSFFTGSFPALNENEALIEGAFTIPSYRGKWIMSKAISEISLKGNNIGVRYVLIFIDVRKISILKICRHSGFHPYTLRREKWFLFKKKVSFADIPKDILEKYYSDTFSV